MNVSATENEPALTWRLRRDLEIACADIDERFGWTIKDPLKLTYFHAAAEEMTFLRLLDGRMSMGRILQTMEAAYPETRFSADNLRAFLISAVNGGLLTSTAIGFGNRVAMLCRRQKSGALARRLGSFLSIRLRGIDPTRLLNGLDQLLGWVFHPACLTALLVFVLGTAVLLIAQAEQLRTELPTIAALMTASNLPVLIVSVAIIKILHEIGHGLTCRHYGGECHELGVVLICFMPLLYCDVSDSWRQRDRRKRIFVAAAGIAVELTLAATCGLLWMWSHPGVLHSFFLNVMLVCSLNTLLVNGNPLLRYDGYYVLSDLLRIPNLGPEARRNAAAFFDRIVFGTPVAGTIGRSLWYDTGMTVFGVASSVYRLVMLSSILWFLHSFLRPYRLEAISAIAAILLAGSVILGMFGSIRQRYRNAAMVDSGRGRAQTGLLFFLSVVAVLVMLPLPHNVRAPFTLTPGISHAVFVTAAGSIRPLAKFDDVVAEGQILATLSNPELNQSIARAEGELAIEETRVRTLTSLRSSGPSAATLLPAAQKAVEHAQSRLKTLLQRQSQLTIRSPANGRILPPPNTPPRRAAEKSAGSWFGYALDKSNQSVWLPEQTLLCRVGINEDLRAVLLVAQADVEFVEPDAEVRLRFTSKPADRVTGTVTTVNATPDRAVDRELMINHMVAIRDSDSQAPIETLYGVQVRFDVPARARTAPIYSTGTASIRCRPMSLAERGWRLLRHTFTFQL